MKNKLQALRSACEENIKLINELIDAMPEEKPEEEKPEEKPEDKKEDLTETPVVAEITEVVETVIETQLEDRSAWTIEDWNKKDSEGLAKLFETDNEKFKSLISQVEDKFLKNIK